MKQRYARLREARAKVQVELEISHARMMSQMVGVLTAEQRAQLAAETSGDAADGPAISTASTAITVKEFIGGSRQPPVIGSTNRCTVPKDVPFR